MSSRIQPPASPAKRIDDIRRAVAELKRRNDAGETVTPRDMAMLQEYQTRYIELLEELETAPVDNGVTVTINGKTIRFDDTDNMANWIAEVINGQ